MRGLTLALTTCAALTLGGCSQISGWLAGSENSNAHYHTYENGVQQTIRTTPSQSYQFTDVDYTDTVYSNSTYSDVSYSGVGYDSDVYDTHTSQTNFSGYDVVLYDGMHGSNTIHTPVDPREAEFVKLNGDSDDTDWRNCEIMSRGYLFMSEYDFMLDPDFEVCMRNKGYVLATEAGSYAVNPVSAKTAGLRSGFSQQYATYSSAYNLP